MFSNGIEGGPGIARNVVLLLLGYIGVALGELFVHWLFTMPLGKPLLGLYLWTNPTRSSGAAILVDLVIPACLLGYLNGRIDRSCPPYKGGYFAFPLCLGIVALYPAYNALIRSVAPVWWWPRHSEQSFFFGLMSLSFGTFITMAATDLVRRD